MSYFLYISNIKNKSQEIKIDSIYLAALSKVILN